MFAVIHHSAIMSASPLGIMKLSASTSRAGICRSLTVFMLASIACAAEPPPAPTRDHILLITIDDLNDWITCLSDEKSGKGHPQASTPHLDRLAKRGVLFTNAHCQAPICRPSRTSFLSGLRPSTTGVYANQPEHDEKGALKPGIDTPWLPNRFQQAGYRTYAVGKLLHQGHKGLGEVLGPQTGQGPYPPKKMGVPPEVAEEGIWDYGAWPPEQQFTDWQIAQWTIGNIAKPISKDDAPRFLSLGFYRPHVPLFAPKKWFDAAPKLDEIRLAPYFADDLDDLPAISSRISKRVSFPKPIDWVLAEESRLCEFTQAYLACTSAMDDCLGDVITALDESEMADNTWIVVFSDHGFHLGEKKHVTKQTLWERSTHVPLIIVPPKRLADTPRGEHCDRPVDLLDVYPTLIEATGLTAAASDKHLDGLSLLPWIRNPQTPRERPALTTLYSGNHSLRDERYRYIRYADGSEELYDHAVDPHEHHNLITKADGRPELRTVIHRLTAWIPKQQAGAPDLLLPKKP
jgi:arylsulfatase A-like enzyme